MRKNLAEQQILFERQNVGRSSYGVRVCMHEYQF
jgi:hypothetical protein